MLQWYKLITRERLKDKVGYFGEAGNGYLALKHNMCFMCLCLKPPLKPMNAQTRD